MAVADRIASIMRRKGQPLTLRRPGTTDIDVTVYGSRIGATAETVVQGQITNSFRVRISNAELADQSAFELPIVAELDQILDADGKAYTIKSVDTKRPGGVIVEHVLMVEG